MDNNTRLIAGITAKAAIVLEEAQDTWVVPNFCPAYCAGWYNFYCNRRK